MRWKLLQSKYHNSRASAEDTAALAQKPVSTFVADLRKKNPNAEEPKGRAQEPKGSQSRFIEYLTEKLDQQGIRAIGFVPQSCLKETFKATSFIIREESSSKDQILKVQIQRNRIPENTTLKTKTPRDMVLEDKILKPETFLSSLSILSSPYSFN